MPRIWTDRGHSFSTYMRLLLRPRCSWGVVVLVAALPAVAASAQTLASSGNVYGNVRDEQGSALPGVSVGLSGPGAPQAASTDAQGDFHFLRLSPGAYS